MALKLLERRTYSPDELHSDIRKKAADVTKVVKRNSFFSRKHNAEIASAVLAVLAYVQMQHPALASEPITEKLKIAAANSAMALTPLFLRRVKERYLTKIVFKNNKRLLIDENDNKEVTEAIRRKTHHAFLDFDSNLHVVPRPFYQAVQAAARTYRKSLEKVKRKK